MVELIDCTGYCLVCGKEATLDRVIGEYAVSLCVKHNSMPSKELYEIITDKSFDNSNIINTLNMKIRIKKTEIFNGPTIWSFEEYIANFGWCYVNNSDSSDEQELATKIKFFKENGTLKKETKWLQEI